MLLDKLVMLVVLVLLAVCGAVGYNIGRHKCSEERRMQQDAYNALEQRFSVASRDLTAILLDQKKAQLENEKEIDSVVRASPVYGRDCIDDAGLRLANRAFLPGS